MIRALYSALNLISRKDEQRPLQHSFKISTVLQNREKDT